MGSKKGASLARYFDTWRISTFESNVSDDIGEFAALAQEVMRNNSAGEIVVRLLQVAVVLAGLLVAFLSLYCFWALPVS